MSGNVNFGDYLLRNEKWLSEDSSRQQDGKLDDDEISVFFSGAHIEIGSESSGDATLTLDEFNNWYSANESAITSYYESIGFTDSADYVNLKAQMMSSMVDFMEQHSDNELDEQKIDGQESVKISDLDATQIGAKTPDRLFDPEAPIPTVGTPDNPISMEPLTEKGALDVARTLCNATEAKEWGTAKEVLDQYLGSNNYTSAEIVMIMNAYEKLNTGKSLIEAIQSDFKGIGDGEKKYRDRLYNAVADVASEKVGWDSKDDIPSDIKTIVNEFRTKITGGLAAPTKYMKEFCNLDAETISQVMIAYQLIYNENPFTTITDRNWWGGEDNITSTIINSMLETANG